MNQVHLMEVVPLRLIREANPEYFVDIQWLETMLPMLGLNSEWLQHFPSSHIRTGCHTMQHVKDVCRDRQLAHGPRTSLMSSLRLRCKISHGIDYPRRVAAVEEAANLIRNSRSLLVRVVPTSGGVFCDLYLHGTYPPDAGIEFALKTTGETFTREIII